MLTRLLAIATAQTPWIIANGLRRIVLGDGTHLRCLGLKGQVWRIHTAVDMLAGRVTQVKVTDDTVGEDGKDGDLEAENLVVSASITGSQGHLVPLRDKGLHVLVRVAPATLLLCDEQGQRIDRLRWLTGRHAPAGRCVQQEVWIHPEEDTQSRLRMVALRVTAEHTKASHRRKKKKAGQDRRTLRSETLDAAGWLCIGRAGRVNCFSRV